MCLILGASPFLLSTITINEMGAGEMDSTEIQGQVDLLPGAQDPIAGADSAARTARLARGRRALSDAERQQRQEAQACSVVNQDEAGAGCTQVLHFAVFFDGTGNSRDAEMKKSPDQRALSNIARLQFSHADEKSNIRKAYIPGVGTSFPDVGDNGGMLGLAIGKGGRDRIKYTLDELDKLIDKQSVKKILLINVSIFGFSRGAAQARAFARDLAARCKAASDGTWHYRDIPLRIIFSGIFDTVCSVWSNLAAATFNAHDGHSDWAHDMRLPPMVEQSVHMTAAHELRKQFPLDSTRDGGRYPANTVEIWYPGVHSDVGGGYDPNHQGRKNSIARFALNEMYDMAAAAGVLLQPIDALDPEVKDEFDKTDDNLQAAYNGYLQSVRRKQGRLELVQAAHMELLHRWLKVRVEKGDDLQSIQNLRSREAALEAELKTLYSKRRGLKDPYQSHTYGSATTEEVEEWNAVDGAIRSRRNALSEVSTQRKGLQRETSALKRKMAALRQKQVRGGRLAMYEQVMLDAWNNPEPLPEAVAQFFDGYGHDSISHWFSGNLAKWRTIYFGDIKYKPDGGDDMLEEDVNQQVAAIAV